MAGGIYKCLSCKLGNGGALIEGVRKQTIPWPTDLHVGGLYFLRPGKLYRVVEKLDGNPSVQRENESVSGKEHMRAEGRTAIKRSGPER